MTQTETFTVIPVVHIDDLVAPIEAEDARLVAAALAARRAATGAYFDHPDAEAFRAASKALRSFRAKHPWLAA